MKLDKSMKIAFIGGGAMGEAMIKCMLIKKLAVPQSMVISDVSPARRDWLGREYRVTTLADNCIAAENADLVVLAVKPFNLPQIMADIKALSSEQLVISVVAGAKLSTLSEGLGHNAVVRAMPNTPAQIGEAMTVWTATPETGQRQKELAQTVLGALGKEIYVADEKYLDMATGLSGSGPGYVFLFIESLIDAGVHIGLPRDIAQRMVIQTVYGSVCTVEKTGTHPAELKNSVTSPGGTTADGLFQLEKGAFRSIIIEAVSAAYRKSQGL